MLKYFSPTLLSLIIGAAGMSPLMSPLWSATVEERDQSAVALSKLINTKMRLLADRQLKEFKEAGYPANDPHLDKVLRALYLDQFRNELPEANKVKNEEELKALRAELDPALKTNKLSVISKLLFSGGGGSSTRMVNEIARIMHPEAPGPLVPMAAEKGQVLKRLMEALGKQVSRLMRLRYGTVTLPQDLRPGEWRELEPAVVSGLLQALGPPKAGGHAT